MVRELLGEQSAALLATLLEFDQRLDGGVESASGTRPRDWRAIEYGPDLSLRSYDDPPMRAVMRRRGLVSDTAIASWIAMEGLGLVVRWEKRVEVQIEGKPTRVASLFVALTRQGRSLAKGAETKDCEAKLLSESAWCLLMLAAGKGPDAVSTVQAWRETGRAPPVAAQIAGVVSGLSKRGLVDVVDSWAHVTITARGAEFVRAGMAEHSAAYIHSGSWARTFGVDRGLG